MSVEQYPTLDKFLTAPIEEIVKVAPATMVYVAGGTRRHAAFAGIPSHSDGYAQWTRQQLLNALDLIFRHGVQHIFAPLVGPDNFNEGGRYRERLLQWISWGLAGDEAIADYTRRGWRARLLITGNGPELTDTVNRLIEATPSIYTYTVWFHIAYTDSPWEWILTKLQKTDATTHQDAIRAIYGEDIPPAKLYLGSGKPKFLTATAPLLEDKVKCYWPQNLGYSIDERLLRTILYDYAYTRATWRQDKTGRAEEVLKYRAAWENPPVIGLGRRLGPFWYPAPISPPPFPEE